jgi:hypothetical protein
MRYFLLVIISLCTIVSCDDGDLITEDFNFEKVTTITKCDNSNILYKVSGQESMILDTSEENFPNIETEPGKPNVLTIGKEASLVYRKYNGNVDSTSICSSPPPANPVVSEEWTISGGTVEITTVKLLDDKAVIIGYNHNIVLKNVTFTSQQKQIVYDSYVFGNYRTNVTVLPFKFADAKTQKCDSKNLIFRYNENEVLLLDVDPLLFANEATTPGKPRVKPIDASNKVVYRLYNGPLNTDFFCATLQPFNPVLTQEWIAENGVEETSGLIKVETVALDVKTFEHTIKLFKTTFKRGIATFSPSPEGDYLFAVYKTEK